MILKLISGSSMQEITAGRRRLDLSLKLEALIALKSVKKFFTLYELSQPLGRPPSIISRYVAGDLSPSKETALRILNYLLDPSFVREYLNRALKRVEWDINALVKDPSFLTYIGLYFRHELIKSIAGSRLDLIIVCSGPSGLLTSTILPYINAEIHYIGDLRLKSKDLKRLKTAAVLAAYLSREAIEELIKLKEALKIVIIEALIVEDPENLRKHFPKSLLIYMLP